MRSIVRLLLTVVMNALLIVAGLLVARIVIGFFGRLGADPWATQLIGLTAPLVPKLGLGTMVTPYRGIFDFNAGAALAGSLALEWVVALLRRFAY